MIAKRSVQIFFASTLTTILLLYLGNSVLDHHLQNQMSKYAAVSFRESDGAENHVILNGRPGFVGGSKVFLSYLDDGYIKISGKNTVDLSGWKKISSFKLEPGVYTLTGLSGFEENTVELQLMFWNPEKDGYDYYFQRDKEVTFQIFEEKDTMLFVRVYPYIGIVDTVARPGVY